MLVNGHRERSGDKTVFMSFSNTELMPEKVKIKVSKIICLRWTGHQIEKDTC